MNYLQNGFKEAFHLIFSLDREFLGIVWVSVKTSTLSTLLATFFGIPCALFLIRRRFHGREILITIFNTLMSLPTVVVGLTVYTLLTRKGPLGNLGLLFTQSAIVLGQVLLIFPIIVALSVAALRGLDPRIERTAQALGADGRQKFFIFLREARYGLTAAVIAGFGRVFAEVGISMMVGGNIKYYTRTITTAIALETAKGEFSMGIALGIVLLTVAFAINIVFHRLQK